MSKIKKLMLLIAVCIIFIQTDNLIYADVTTGLVGQYDFDDNVKNLVNGTEARVVENNIYSENEGSELIFTDGVDGSSILFNGVVSNYGLELLDCVLTGNSFTVSYDVFYTMYTQDAATLYLYMPMDEDDVMDDSYIEFGQAGSFSLAYVSSIAMETYYDDGYATGKRATYVYPNAALDYLVDGIGKQNWRANWVNWANITYVVDGFDIKVYVNGENIPVDIQYNTEKMFSVNTATRLFLGISHGEFPVSGAIDNLYIFDRILSDADVLELIEGRDYSKQFVMPSGVEVDQTKDYDICWGLKQETTHNSNEKEDIDTEQNTDNAIKESTLQADNTGTDTEKNVEDTYKIVKMITMILAVLLFVTVGIIVFLLLRRQNEKEEKTVKKSPETVRKITYEIFNIRNLLIIACAVFVIGMLWMAGKSKNRQDEKKDIISDNVDEMQEAQNKGENIENEEINPRYGSKYVRDILVLNSTPELLSDKEHITNMGQLMDKYEIFEEDMQGIMIGVDVDGNGIERYYFTDTDVIKKVMDRLRDMELTKMTDPGVVTYAAEPDWDIQLCRRDSEYGFRISGETTNFDGYFRTTVNEVYNEAYYTAKDPFVREYESELGSDTQLLYDEEIISFFKDIVDDNVKKLDMETAIDISNDMDIEKLFGYKHTAPVYTSSLIQGGNRAFLVEFPIEGTEYKILFQKQAFTINDLPANEVEKMELHNSKEEFIDMISATEEEIREFIK